MCLMLIHMKSPSTYSFICFPSFLRHYVAAGDYVALLFLLLCVFSPFIRVQSLWLHGLLPTRLICPWDSPGKNTAMGCHTLLQGIFPTPRLNLWLPAFPALKWILGPLSHLGSPSSLYIILWFMCPSYHW